MADNDFYKEPMDEQNQNNTVEIPETPQTFRIGEEDYTQDQLSEMVGLGKMAKEMETKWNRPIDKLYPDYTRTKQELADLQRQRQDQESQQIQQKSQQGQQLTDAEVRKQAAVQLKELMSDPDLQNYLRQNYVEQRQAERLLEDSEYVVNDYAEQGLPKTTVEDILEYMGQTGIRNPDIAYREMFRDEYEESRAKKLESVRQPGLYTQSQSTAGAKQPSQPKVTKENLGALVAEALRGEG